MRFTSDDQRRAVMAHLASQGYRTTKSGRVMTTAEQQRRSEVAKASHAKQVRKLRNRALLVTGTVYGGLGLLMARRPLMRAARAAPSALTRVARIGVARTRKHVRVFKNPVTPMQRSIVGRGLRDLPGMVKRRRTWRSFQQERRVASQAHRLQLRNIRTKRAARSVREVEAAVKRPAYRVMTMKGRLETPAPGKAWGGLK